MRLQLSSHQLIAFSGVCEEASIDLGLERLAALAVTASRLDQITSLAEISSHLILNEIYPQLNPFGQITVMVPGGGDGERWEVEAYTHGFGYSGEELFESVSCIGRHMAEHLRKVVDGSELLPEAVATPHQLEEWLGLREGEFNFYSHAFACRFSGEPAAIFAITRSLPLTEGEREDMRAIAALFGAALARLVFIEKDRFVAGQRPSALPE